MSHSVEHLAVRRAPKGATVAVSRLQPGSGSVEWHVLARADDLEGLEEAYLVALSELGIARGSSLFRRVFVARAREAANGVAASRLATHDGPAALSVVEQPPLPAPAVALWAYHVEWDGPATRRGGGSRVAVDRGSLTHLWLAGLEGAEAGGGPHGQTRALLAAARRELRGEGATLLEHALRTWVFLNEVHRDYAEVAGARREVFAEEGLVEATHFIASTGIQARRATDGSLVSLDLYAVPGIEGEQIGFLHAPHRLGSPTAYGPTFERGVRVDHGDRRHLLVSGTASIDPEGRVVHEGDVAAQLDRALGNVDALLEDGGASRSDLAFALVYLADPKDLTTIEPLVAEGLAGVPHLILQAPVCRPGWLVEVEPWAAIPRKDPRFPPY